nr:TIGR02680 family protein [Paenibacillus bovis]
MRNKWKMNRAGLLNFWYYDDEVFDFADGKLLLRGSNGSGKSVTMQSFLPVLLDGKTSPDRLDPFGSRARRMEDYLLGEKEIVNRDERTGYLYLEFKRKDTQQFMTIGIGLQAKRNKQMNFWGFVITDNRRIGHDLELYKLESNAGEKQKIPRSRVELENVIGDGGQLVQTKGEYMNLVNKYIFGFETIEAYEDLIKLLIQLRSPKLSKDFRPTVIYEILEAALPPLTDDDLRHLSDTIEQMDQTKQQIEQLERENEAITSLNRVYTTYNKRILAVHANELIMTGKRLVKEEKALDDLEKESTQLSKEITELTDGIQKLSQEQETFEKQRERLQSHKVWNLQKELNEAKKNLSTQQEDLQRKEEQFAAKRKKENQLTDERKQVEEEVSNRLSTIDDMIIDLDNDAYEASFAQHDMNKSDFKRHQADTFDFTVWMKETAVHVSALEKIAVDFQIFEGLKQRFQEKDKELADETKQHDDAAHQAEEWERIFESDKQQKMNDIYQWAEEKEWLKTEEAAFQEASRVLQSLYEVDEYEGVKRPFREVVFRYQQQEGEKLTKWKVERDLLEEQIKEKERDIQEWKDKKDPEPAIDPITKEARQKLLDKNVPFVPFYAAVEFHDDVDQETQKRIEAAMIDSGLLDALITAEEIDIEYDRILLPKPNIMGYTMADFLRPDVEAKSTVPASRVDDVLRSITITEDSSSTLSISENGAYQLGLLKGHAVPVENIRYIGRTARKRYRQEQMERLQAEMVELKQQHTLISHTIEKLESTIKAAGDKLAQFPNDNDLRASFDEMTKSRFNMTQHKVRLQALSDQLKKIHDEYVQVKSELDQQTRLYNIEATLPAYQEAIGVIKRYEKDLSKIEKVHIQYLHGLKRETDLRNQLQDLLEEMDELKGDIHIIQDRGERLRQDMEQIKQQLEQEGVADIQKQIANVQQKLQEIYDALDDKKTTLPSKKSDKKYILDDIEEKTNLVTFWKNMYEAWEISFGAELKRGYVWEVEETEQEVTEVAKKIIREYGILLQEKDPTKLSNQLNQEYLKQQSNLLEYRVHTLNASVQIPAWMDTVTDEDKLPHIEQWKQKGNRMIIELDYLGKKVSPYTVQQQIEEDQNRQQSLLNNQDKALYEEILFKSVGQKLRARIRRAEQWAKEMDKLMTTRDTSSGLSFSIRWKPRTADVETEMDTIDLVRLLKQDARLLKEEDLDKITTHFRSKIAKAKELMDGHTEIQSLLQVLKEVLDYRKWFSFILYFQREGETKRELTNNQFYKFSGGEKAMAMYIPLFTACYSRYQEAEEGAPYIISLDEAFAGVDENNIREMFEVVEQLGFNYIMNSQVLWGDYDTISQLAVCELVRPKNADFVSVIRYYWDGKRLDLQLPHEEIEDKTLV